MKPETLTLQERLIKVQTELKAPKGQFNSFGKYKYRNQEDILEALKPLLGKYNVNMIITDRLQEIAGMVYVEATVKVFGDSSEPVIETSGQAFYADRKGMDPAQSTGSSSSYARKYALGGMFLIDDTKDPDFTNEHDDKQPKAKGKETLPASGDTFDKAKAFISKGGSIESIKSKYTLTKEVEQLLLN